MKLIETAFTNIFNSLTDASHKRLENGVLFGHIVFDDVVTRTLFFIPTTERARHISVWGKTGSGKSFFLRHLMQHDIRAGHGFLAFDLHGDITPAMLSYLAAREVDPARIVIIDPTSRDWAVGLNPLEAIDEAGRYLHVTEVCRTLCDRWNFTGAQTEELLRNSLLVLSENGLTLLEVSLLLADDNYRATLLKNVTNAEVSEYFELRFNPLSDSMKVKMREPVLNKLSELTADPHFRFILGTRKSTVNFDKVLNSDYIVLVKLDKGSLGLHAPTLGALIYTNLKAAIFRRKRKTIFTVYADEIQNLVSASTDFDVLLSESRKYGVGMVTANQFGAQLPPRMRSAMQAIGTRIFFQLSPEDSEAAAREISGAKGMADRMKNLPPRHFVVKQGNNKPYQVVTPDVVTAKASSVDLSEASNAIHARRREDIVRDILARRPKPSQLKEVLSDWE